MEARSKRDRFESELNAIMELAYRYGLRLSGNADDAMDLVQDSTLLAFRAFDSYQAGTNFKAWFLRILTNRYFQNKRQARMQTLSIDEAPDLFLYEQTKKAGVPVEDDPARWVLGKMDGELVQQALDKLPEDYRVVALLHFMSEMPYEEIAQTLDIPIGTVRSRLHRGRKLLQMSLWQIAQDKGFTQEATHG
jgi:RNA polymerase sigma-70 factor (ECF subfamily)